MKKYFLLFILIAGLSCKSLAQYPSGIEHVVLLGFDGFGGYAVEKAEMPHLKNLMENGSYTLHRRSVLPSSSAVNWASMFMGAGPTMHGYTEWNSKVPEIPSVITNKNGLFPSIFSEIKAQKEDAAIAVIYSWEGIGYLLEDGTVDIDVYTEDDEDLTLETVIKTIKEVRPVLTMVHFDEPDGVGHSIGHDTPEYYEELKNVDARIGEILAAIEEAGIASRTLVVISSDHGGVDKGHGGKALSEVESPWIMAGPGVTKGKEISEPTIIYDIAPTLVWALGLQPNPHWRGKVVKAFFEK